MPWCKQLGGGGSLLLYAAQTSQAVHMLIALVLALPLPLPTVYLSCRCAKS